MTSALRVALTRYSVRVSPPGGPEFKLAAGGTSRFYCDVRASALRGDVTPVLARDLYDFLNRGEFGPVQAVAGVVLGGCHLASIVAMHSMIPGVALSVPPHPLDVVFVRKKPKDHGTEKLVESPVLSPGRRVVLLEDVVTTGESSLSAASVLSASGFSVAGILAVVDRRTGDRPQSLGGLPFRALFQLEELLPQDSA